MEKEFIQKLFYETLLNEESAEHPIRMLAEAYLDEQSQEIPNLTPIRFAQGELYFHYKDFESAIFKWANLEGALEPWARKNTADAYYELGMLANAEDWYKSVHTDSLTLNTEVALQLFSLYIEKGSVEQAVRTIKTTIVHNPDYPNVTELGRAFFEGEKDWPNAIELAANEAVRTKSLQWFDALQRYVDEGVIGLLAPEYFSEVLRSLRYLDRLRFEKMATGLWKTYRKKETYFSWINLVSRTLSEAGEDHNGSWPYLSTCYHETFLELTNGQYLIDELKNTIPQLLENWFRITDSAQAASAASALLAWGEIFPDSIGAEFMREAENLVSSSRSNVNIMDGALQLFESLVNWSKNQEDEVENRLKWMIRQLTDFHNHHLIVTGMSGTGKSTFINFALGDDRFKGTPTLAFVRFRNDEQEAIREISNEGVKPLSAMPEFRETEDGFLETAASIVDVKLPASFLEEHGLSLIDTPGFNGFGLHDYEVVDYLRMADSLLFVLNADAPLTDKEREILAHLKETVPEIPIHFLLNKMDSVYNETEMIRIVDETWARVNSYFPHAKIFAFSSQFDSRQQLSDLSSFIHSIIPRGIMEEDRTGKLLFFIRKAITELLHRRVELENRLVESNQWNEGTLVKLNGALNQLGDIEAEKTRIIKRSYQKIKEDIQDEMRVEIPGILKGSSDFITEESDFGNLHVSLNNEMNNRIQNYLQQVILPKYLSELQNWIELSSEEFHQSQLYFNEMAQGFNGMYGTERFQLKCDFRVLDDWGRDAFRMTNGVQMENMNIFMRSTPSQFLLKSAGKLFGALSQNNALLYNKYKSSVENDDYYDVTKSIVNGFMQKFELFEKSLERDIALFFHHPVAELKQAVNDAEEEMVLNEETLRKMRTNPELYRDPLRLFEMKQRQFEWLTLADRVI